MAYVIPDWKKSIDQNKFEVTVGDETFSIPKAEYLLGGQVQRLTEVDEIDGGVYAVLDEIVPGLGSALLRVPVKYVKEFMEAWQKDSGVSLGESAASSN